MYVLLIDKTSSKSVHNSSVTLFQNSTEPALRPHNGTASVAGP